MSSIKLPHASGNSMSIAAPATNPASHLELKLPATIGTAGQVLANSSTPGTLEFAAAGGGKILQVKYTSIACANSNEQDITSTSYVAVTKPELTITPTASGNKIIIMTQIPFSVDNNDSAVENTLRVRLLRTQSGESDVIVGTSQYASTGEHSPGGWLGLAGNIVQNFVDTSANGSAITYKYTAMLAHSADSVRFHLGDAHTGISSSIIAMEVAAST